MLEPADPGYVAVVLRVHEAAEQARLVGSPGFSIMLDTHQLEVVEPSFEEGFAAAAPWVAGGKGDRSKGRRAF